MSKNAQLGASYSEVFFEKSLQINSQEDLFSCDEAKWELKAERYYVHPLQAECFNKFFMQCHNNMTRDMEITSLKKDAEENVFTRKNMQDFSDSERGRTRTYNKTNKLHKV